MENLHLDPFLFYTYLMSNRKYENQIIVNFTLGMNKVSFYLSI